MTPDAVQAAQLGKAGPDGNPPDWVTVVPRLSVDLEALMRLTACDTPPDIPNRASNDTPVYIVGDASGAGFGSCVWVQGDSVIDAEFGRWTFDVNYDKSSNFRKSANLVILMKRLVVLGRLPAGTEVFICTDNAVAESTYFKGLSKSSQLHELILQL